MVRGQWVYTGGRAGNMPRSEEKIAIATACDSLITDVLLPKYLPSISSTLMRLARNGDVEGFRAYVHGEAFLAAFNGLDPERRPSAMRTYMKAEMLCEAKARLPLRKPKRIDAKRAEKVTWSGSSMHDRLTDAYFRSGGDDEKAARILGVTVGSARLARRRHPGEVASSHRQKAVAAAGTALCLHPLPPRDRQRHVLLEGFLGPPIVNRAGRARQAALKAALVTQAVHPYRT